MNLHPEIKRLLDAQEEQGGVDLSNMPIGTKIEAQTRNTLYKIEVMPDNKFMVEGGRYFPEPTETYVGGSTWGGSMIKLKWLGIGMHIEFPKCLTTAVQSLKIIAADNSWLYEL